MTTLSSYDKGKYLENGEWLIIPSYSMHRQRNSLLNGRGAQELIQPVQPGIWKTSLTLSRIALSPLANRHMLWKVVTF